MKTQNLELVGGQVNALVIKAAGRKYPGVLIQGDSLRNLASLVEEVAEAADDADEVRDLSQEIGDILRSYLSVYEQVLLDEGYELPYSRP